MIRALVFYSNTVPSTRNTVAETFWRGLVGVSPDRRPPAWLQRLGLPGRAIFRSLNHTNDYRSLGYVDDWKSTLASRNDAECTFINVANLVELWGAKAKKAINSADLVIVLHSALGDDTTNLQMVTSLLKDRKGSLAVFIGNEYVDLKQKKRFLKASQANYVCSQLPEAAAHFVYDGIDDISVIEMPHGLNPSRFNIKSKQKKENQFCFRGAKYPAWIGDSERNRFIATIKDRAQRMSAPSDIQHGNISAGQWARLLNISKGTIGAEAGTYFLDRNNEIIDALKRVRELDADFDFAEFVSSLGIKYVSGKAISSRHFEAIGCGTVQLLLEGSYNNVLVKDVHYLSVKHDYSNLDEKLDEFDDHDRRQELAFCALEHVLDKHTYDKRIDQLLNLAGFA